ncbi:hypothetical protein TRAPUB_4885 [Trametes pubescens]|uniref:Uncharacterized protein n=1 Tax=Trametes pubescens TaxID=154538 RepID=A0A1M2VA42_TRAPU|nr:hypothetical protein TRAPUB_4885 [Trametes pubescens]
MQRPRVHLGEATKRHWFESSLDEVLPHEPRIACRVACGDSEPGNRPQPLESQEANGICGDAFAILLCTPHNARPERR